MIPVIPWYVTLIVVGTQITVAIVVWSVLASAARRSGLAPTARRRVRIGAAVFLTAWLGGALLAAPAPASLVARDPFYITPLIPVFFVVPVTLVFVVLWRSAALRHVLAAVSLPALHAVQIYRLVGVVFLILLAQGQLPAHFALPAGWGDVAVGLLAPLMAFVVAREVRGASALASAWNVLGLLDLVVAVGMGTGFLAPLVAPELGPRVPSAAAMGIFPMILVPTFTVPVAVLLHLFALARLRRELRFGPGLEVQPAQS